MPSLSEDENEARPPTRAQLARVRRRTSTIDEGRFFRARGRRLIGGVDTNVRAQSNEMIDEYTFVQLGDPQFGMLSDIASVQWLRNLRKLIEYATCGKNDGKSLIPIPELENRFMDANALLELEIELARKSVHAINKLVKPRPKFVVVCGDLVHAFPTKNPKLNAKQVKIFKQIYSQIDKDIELVCCCGNHDIGDRPTPATLQLWKKRFGDDYFAFWVGKDKYICLNSQLYKDGSMCPEEYKEQDKWLDTQLYEQEDRRHTVVFSHIPPFIFAPDEPSGYFPLAKPIRLNLLQRMVDGGVSHWFAAHYHRNAIGTYKTRGKKLVVVTTGAVGGNIRTDASGDRLGLSGMGTIVGSDKLSGIRVVHVSSRGLQHSFMKEITNTAITNSIRAHKLHVKARKD